MGWLVFVCPNLLAGSCRSSGVPSARVGSVNLRHETGDCLPFHWDCIGLVCVWPAKWPSPSGKRQPVGKFMHKSIRLLGGRPPDDCWRRSRRAESREQRAGAPEARTLRCGRGQVAPPEESLSTWSFHLVFPLPLSTRPARRQMSRRRPFGAQLRRKRLHRRLVGGLLVLLQCRAQCRAVSSAVSCAGGRPKLRKGDPS